MEKNKETFQEVIVGNILKILKTTDLKRSAIAAEAFTEPTALSKVLSGQRRLTVNELANIANAFGMSPLDLITYPVKYVPAEKNEEPTEVYLQLRLTKEKKDQVLKLVFGENNIEILNK